MPERTLLSAARHGWPFELNYPYATSQDLREQAFLGAAAAGNVDMLTKLHNEGVMYDMSGRYDTAATIAASMGHVHVLEHLGKNGGSILYGSENIKSALWHAARDGQCTVVDFLLKTGAQPSEDDFSIALQMGETDVMHQFIDQVPEFASTYLPNGQLRLASFFSSYLSSSTCCTVLKFLVRMGLDINGVDQEGRTAIHLAAKAGHIEVVQSIETQGADIGAIDGRGMSAFEIALIEKHDDVAAWLAHRTGYSCNGYLNSKYTNAEAILERSRSTTLEMLASGGYSSCFSGKTRDERTASAEARWRVADMDNKLAEIWRDEISAAALQGYVESILNSQTEVLLQRARSAVNLASTSYGIARETAGVQDERSSAALPVAEAVLSAFLSRSYLDEAAQQIARDLSSQEIGTLCEFFETPLGAMWMAGRKAKAYRETSAMLNFVHSTT